MLPDGTVLESERLADRLQPRYIPMERAVEYLLAAKEPRWIWVSTLWNLL